MKSPAWLIIPFVLISPAAAVDVLPGTQPLTWDGDISLKMVDDLHAFADRETAASIQHRARHWHRDFTSMEAYENSIEPNRKRLAKYLGVTTPRDAPTLKESRYLPPYDTPKLDLSIGGVKFVHVSWPARGDAHGYALHAAAKDGASAPVVILVTDQHFCTDPQSAPGGIDEFIARLHRAGCELFVMSTVNRLNALSVVAGGVRRTDQSHREFVYRQAFEMGRHVQGYEVERILSLVDWLARKKEDAPVGVFGFGEGGRVALLAGALDDWIDVTGVCGGFGSQQRMWEDPIDRNIWGYLDEFGDAEVASLIAPRQLVVDAAPGARFEVVHPIDGRPVNRAATAAPGTLRVPPSDEVTAEVERIRQLVPSSKEWDCSVVTKKLYGAPDETTAESEFLRRLELEPSAVATTITPEAQNSLPADILLRGLNRGTKELIDHTQSLVRESEYVRKEWWKNADRASRDPEKWQASLKPYREHLYDEVLGRFDLPKLPPNARTRKIYDEPKYAGYEVVLNVFGGDAEHVDVWAYGILLVPKDVQPGERRPVVVCQHGLEGRPQDTIEAGIPGERYYHRFAALLAERGFVVFAPQNPYIGKDHFRQLVRKLYPLKKTLWSVIVPQHEQITDWLASLDFVDGQRIGFYGLSYGGKTAMRVPALVERYCLSICSGDFNEWIRKCTSVRDTFSYMGTHEYEMFEFDLGHTFNYAEMAYLIAPRPFMVERGHRDGVGIDEWVSYEYAKVRMLYADLKIPERTEIEYFDGPHEIHGVGTFAFLHKHLNWPVPGN